MLILLVREVSKVEILIFFSDLEGYRLDDDND